MQGLAQNRKQFLLLVLVNAFVGSMVGLERSVMPGFSNQKFGIEAHAALLSFVAAFGISKAFSNLAMGWVTGKLTRKKILIAGWIFALPVPFLLMYSDSWNGILLANILLGINQGFAWSATVIMKIDLVGERQRGLAMGINEFAGYISVGLASYLSARIANHYGYEFFPFLPGIFFSIMGLLISVLAVRDTAAFVTHEKSESKTPLLDNPFLDVSWKHKNMGTVTLNGIVNNMNDAVVWGLLPVLLLQKQMSLAQIGIITGIYPVVWGLLQLITGRMGDLYCKKQIITSGMIVQAAGILLFTISGNFWVLASAAAVLGMGTALVYPNFLTVIAENSHPEQRGRAMGVFRFWRDGGYVIGALLSGWFSDNFGLNLTLVFVAVITMLAGILAHFRMCCTRRKWWYSGDCNETPVLSARP